MFLSTTFHWFCHHMLAPCIIFPIISKLYFFWCNWLVNCFQICYVCTCQLGFQMIFSTNDGWSWSKWACEIRSGCIYDSNMTLLICLYQSLLCDPNPNSPANSEAARLFSENKREYNRRVREIVEQSWTAD